MQCLFNSKKEEYDTYTGTEFNTVYKHEHFFVLCKDQSPVDELHVVFIHENSMHVSIYDSYTHVRSVSIPSDSTVRKQKQGEYYMASHAHLGPATVFMQDEAILCSLKNNFDNAFQPFYMLQKLCQVPCTKSLRWLAQQRRSDITCYAKKWHVLMLMCCPAQLSVLTAAFPSECEAALDLLRKEYF